MKKRILSLVIALSMVLSLAAIPAVAADTDETENGGLVYYDLQEQEIATSRGTGTSWKPNTSSFDPDAGGFYPRDNYAYVRVKSGKVLEFIGSATTTTYLLQWCALKPTALKADADYSVPLRKAVLSFKTSVEDTSLYNTPAKIWYNLYAVSAKGIKALKEAGHPISDALFGEIEFLEDNELVLFLWGTKSTTRSSYSGSGFYSEMYPICTLGTVGQTKYSDEIEYIYKPLSDGTLNVFAMKVGGKAISTLMDGVTPLAGLSFKETGETMFRPYSLEPASGEVRAAMVLIPKLHITNSDGSKTPKNTTLTYKTLRYEGVRGLVDGIEFSTDKEEMPVCGDGIIKVKFIGTPDTETFSSWQDYVVIEDENGNDFTDWTYIYNKETNTLEISVDSDSPLRQSVRYNVTVKNTIPYLGGTLSGQKDVTDSFKTTFSKIDRQSASSNKVEGDFEVYVDITNKSLASEEFDVTAVLYQKDGGRISMIENTSEIAEVGVGQTERELYIGILSVPDDEKEYFIKVFFTENGEAICNPIVIGEAGESEISDVEDSGERITLDIQTEPDSGSVSIDGLYTGSVMRPLHTTVEDKDGNIVYIDQLIPEEDGKFGTDFNLLPGSSSGEYTVNIKAIGETLFSETFEIDFSAVKPVVTELKLKGAPYFKTEVEADYSYFQFANEPDASVITWLADIGENGEFTEIGTEKTLYLEEELLGHMVKFTILAKTAGGTTADAEEELAPFKVVAGPVASNVEVIQEGNTLSASYDFIHPLGYQEFGSVITWYRANSQYGEFEKVQSSVAYTLTETDDNKYFKAEVVPKVDPTGLLDIEATGVAVESEPFKVSYEYPVEPEKPELPEFLYYDLENQKLSGAKKSGYGYGSIASAWGEDPAKAQGGFLRRNTWSEVQVKEIVSTSSIYKIMTMVADPYLASKWAKPSPFGMLISSLNPDGNYDVPYRKVSMSFRTSSSAATNYDTPVALWFNLYAVSKKGLLELADANHSLSAEARAELEKLADNSLILFWWKLKNLSLIESTDSANSAEMYPICSLGTVGQTSYSAIEYVYSLGKEGSNDTVTASQIKVNDETKETLLDGVTRFDSLKFVDTNSGSSAIYKAASLRASFSDYKYVAVVGVPNNHKKTTKSDGSIEQMTLTFRQLRYEGMGGFVDNIEIAGGEENADVCGDSLIRIYFGETPDTEAISNWKSYVTIKNADGKTVNDWTGSYDENEKVFTISVSKEKALSHASEYSVTIKKTLPYIGVSAEGAGDTVKSFITDYKKLEATTSLTEVSSGEFAVTAQVTNRSLFSGNFTAKAVLYKKEAGRLVAFDTVLKNANVAYGKKGEVQVGEFDVPDDGAEYFVKVFFIEGEEIIADSLIIGTPSESEIIDITAGSGVITAEAIAIADEGRIELDGKYSDTVIRPVYIKVKNPSGSVVFEDQLSVNEKGRFGIDFNVSAGSENGEYTLEIKPIGKSVSIVKVRMNFSSVKPVAKNPSLSGISYKGNEVSATYDYYHAGSEADASVIEWYANIGENGNFVKIADGKTITLGEELMGHMVKFVVLAKSADGKVAKEEITSPEYKVTGGPVASNVVIGQRSNTLTFTYNYSHMLGYEEKGSSYVWYRADSEAGKFEKVYDGASYTLKPFDNGKYFKVEVTPKSNPNQIGSDGEKVLPVEACGESVMSSSFKAEYKTSAPAGSGGGGGGGGSSSGDKVQKVETAPVDLSGTVDLTDIKGHWAEADIYNLYDKGIVKGRTEHTYEPEGKITRAEFIALIVRALNLKSVNGASFGDVSASDWYYDVLSTASEHGILTGSEGNAYPNRNITRQEMAAIIVRAYEMGETKIELDGDLLSFDDAASIDVWAIEAVAKAKTAGLIKGDGNTFRPLDNTSRAEAAVIVSRLLATR